MKTLHKKSIFLRLFKEFMWNTKAVLVTALTILGSIPMKQATAQVWKDNMGSPSTISTKTDDKVGVGTSAPEGKTEVKYCDPQEPGVIVTKDNCNGATQYGTMPTNEGINRNVIIGIFDPNNPPPPAEVTINLAWANQPYILTNNFVAGGLPALQFSKHFPNGASGFNAPLFWGREYGMNTFNNTQTSVTRFIVMPNGFTGINVATPRASLDVASGLDGIATAIFGTYARQNSFIPAGTTQSANYTQHLSIVARTKVATCNKITQEGDVGIYFTDGKGLETGVANGSNQAAGLVIAPWVNNTHRSGGIRIDANGNIDLAGDVQATRFEVLTKWWPDFVFDNDYNLMSLDSLGKYIEQNKHLPGFGTDSIIINNGLDIGETQAIQQQKIEELTLYIIEQSKLLKLQAQRQDEFEQLLNILIKK